MTMPSVLELRDILTITVKCCPHCNERHNKLVVLPNAYPSYLICPKTSRVVFLKELHNNANLR